MTTVWQGTDAEAAELNAAFHRYCECQFDETSGKPTKTCPPHAELLSNQMLLDHLLFARRMRDRFNHQEHILS